ncbi:MAG TPA: hypothetical protein VJ948_11055 [Acidimicrobiia bacterium]|nr:hypothetical protein [Acidimicrobiia bacterium]
MGGCITQPAAGAAGAPGQAFMEKLMGESKLGPAMGVSAIATLASGIALYWIDFGAVLPFNAAMLGFAIGGVAAIAVWLISIFVSLPAGRRMEQLGAAAQAGEEVGAEMARLGGRLSREGSASMWLLIVAVLAMAVARYL